MKTTRETPVLEIDAESRQRFGAIADVLIPAAEGMPSATEADVPGRWLDRVVGALPELGPRLLELLEAAGEDPTAYAEAALAAETAEIDELLGIATQAYYMSPKVRKRLRYPGQKATPVRPDESEYYLRDGLLDPVIERGSICREVARD